MLFRFQVLCVVIFFQSVAFADGEASWRPFFEPKVKAEDVLSSHQGHFLGRGGEGTVSAVPTASHTVIAEKQYHGKEFIKESINSFYYINELSKKGLLEPFKVVKLLSSRDLILELQFIEGLTLRDLIKQMPQDPRVRELYARYLLAIRLVQEKIRKSDPVLRPVIRYRSYADACARYLVSQHKAIVLASLMLFDGKSEPRGKTGSDLGEYDDEELLFGIETQNVVVEAKTGDFYIIDPR